MPALRSHNWPLPIFRRAVSNIPASIAAAAQIVRLYVSPGHNYVGHFGREPGTHPMLERSEVECVAGHGLVGDRYFRPNSTAKGQVTFFAEEVHARLCLGRAEPPPPSVYRRNIITRGLDLAALIGAEFEIQGIRFFGTEESRPCDWMNRAFGHGARELLVGQGGLRARILSDGILRIGSVHEPHQPRNPLP